MNILLSAYACEPNKGSEPGVGWNWALTAARLEHNVWVVTRKNNKASIESYWSERDKPGNLNFIYYDVPRWISWWKKAGRGVHLYYFFWQIGIYFFIKKYFKSMQFDVIHHSTFVSIRQPSFLGLLGVPFVFGPVAGGESIPYHLRREMGLKDRVWELCRDVINFLVPYDPLMNITFGSANRIFVTSKETMKLLPKRYRNKAEVSLAIGITADVGSESMSISPNARKARKFLFVGNFLFLKGLLFGLNAFSEVLKKHPDATLTMLGRGKGEAELKFLVNKLKIEKNVIFRGWVSQHELPPIYQDHDVLLFPSLRDSGGMVVLEALSFGLPVICTSLGGPGAIINDTCGIAVCPNDIVNSLSSAMLELMDNQDVFFLKSLGAKSRVVDFSWEKLASNVYCFDGLGVDDENSIGA